MKSLILAITILFTSILSAQDISYLEYLRTDLKKQKRDIIAETMKLTEDEADIFWSIYSKYESDLDELAIHLANKKHEFDIKRAELIWNYYNIFKDELNPIDAAMFYQVESQLLLLIDVQIAGEIPIIKKPKSK